MIFSPHIGFHISFKTPPHTRAHSAGALVDPSLVDFRSLSDEVKFRIFDYLWGKGVRSSELGVDPTYANKIKNRRARVSDALLERMLRMLSVDEFAVLVGSTST
jgi:hypothetical protein